MGKVSSGRDGVLIWVSFIFARPWFLTTCPPHVVASGHDTDQSRDVGADAGADAGVCNDHGESSWVSVKQEYERGEERRRVEEWKNGSEEKNGAVHVEATSCRCSSSCTLVQAGGRRLPRRDDQQEHNNRKV